MVKLKLSQLPHINNYFIEMDKTMKKITLIVNYKNKDNLDLAYNIKDYLLMNNAELFLPDNKPGFSVEECDSIDFTGVDVAVVLGETALFFPPPEA